MLSGNFSFAVEGIVTVLPNLYDCNPVVPATADEIEAACSILVLIPLLSARNRKSTCVVATRGSPGTKKPTRDVFAFSTTIDCSSTCARDNTLTFIPTIFSRFGMLKPDITFV